MNGDAMNGAGTKTEHRVVRTALGAIGAGCAGFGVFTLVTTQRPAALVWVLVWLAATVVIHDGLLVPGVSFARAGLRAAGRRLPVTVVASVEVGFMVFATIALFVVPEIWAQRRGNANPTVLQGDYGTRLLMLGILIACVVVIVSASAMVRARIRRR